MRTRDKDKDWATTFAPTLTLYTLSRNNLTIRHEISHSTDRAISGRSVGTTGEKNKFNQSRAITIPHATAVSLEFCQDGGHHWAKRKPLRGHVNQMKWPSSIFKAPTFHLGSPSLVRRRRQRRRSDNKTKRNASIMALRGRGTLDGIAMSDSSRYRNALSSARRERRRLFADKTSTKSKTSSPLEASAKRHLN